MFCFLRKIQSHNITAYIFSVYLHITVERADFFKSESSVQRDCSFVVAAYFQRNDFCVSRAFCKVNNPFHKACADVIAPHCFFTDMLISALCESLALESPEKTAVPTISLFSSATRYNCLSELVKLFRYSRSFSTVKEIPYAPNVRLSVSAPTALQYSNIFSASDTAAFLITAILPHPKIRVRRIIHTSPLNFCTQLYKMREYRRADNGKQPRNRD